MSEWIIEYECVSEISDCVRGELVSSSVCVWVSELMSMSEWTIKWLSKLLSV